MGKGEGDLKGKGSFVFIHTSTSIFLILKSLILTYVPKHEPPSHLPPHNISQHCLNFMKMLCSTIKFSKDFFDVDHL